VISSGDGCPWSHPRQGSDFCFSRLRSAYPVRFTAGTGNNLLAGKTDREWSCSLHRVSRLIMHWSVCIPFDIRTELNAIKGWHRFTYNFTIYVKSLLLILHCIFLYRILNLCIYVFAMAKVAFNKKKTLFTSKLDINVRNKLVKYYIWSMVLYGAETWTLRAADQKYLESLKCGAGEGWRRAVGPIMWEMKTCYLESMNRGISYMK